jgi:hypothetical protein
MTTDTKATGFYVIVGIIKGEHFFRAHREKRKRGAQERRQHKNFPNCVIPSQTPIENCEEK